MVILNGDLMRAEETAFWKFSSGKLFLNSQNTLKKMTTMESDLSKVAPACLLKSLSVMGNFLVKFFKGLLKTVYSTRNTTQIYKWRSFVCGGGVAFFLLWL